LLKSFISTGLSIVLQLKSTTQSPITTNMATTEIFSILAYCSPIVHGVLAALWTSNIHTLLPLSRRSLRRLVSMVCMPNFLGIAARLLFHNAAISPPGVPHLSFRLYYLALSAWPLGPYHEDTKSRILAQHTTATP
jgi:hypothetical protein